MPALLSVDPIDQLAALVCSRRIVVLLHEPGGLYLLVLMLGWYHCSIIRLIDYL